MEWIGWFLLCGWVRHTCMKRSLKSSPALLCFHLSHLYWFSEIQLWNDIPRLHTISWRLQPSPRTALSVSPLRAACWRKHVKSLFRGSKVKTGAQLLNTILATPWLGVKVNISGHWRFELLSMSARTDSVLTATADPRGGWRGEGERQKQKSQSLKKAKATQI